MGDQWTFSLRSRSTKSSRGDNLEITDKEAEQLIRDVAELRPPVFVFAGADPLGRKDINSLVRYAVACKLRPTMILTPRSQATRNVIAGLKDAQLARIGFTLNGPAAESHDRICGVEGSFARTLQGIKWANECRLPVQVHTQLCRENLPELENMAALLKQFRLLVWSISFPVPQPAEQFKELLSAEEFEEAFVRLYNVSQIVSCKIKTVEAQHYRRFVVQQRATARRGKASLVASLSEEIGIPGVLPVNESRASVFISSTGQVFPSMALQLSAGNVRDRKITDIYRNSVLFNSLRDPSQLKGKCGYCEFREMCGGSRARAWALAGDMFSEEQSCTYQPMLARKTG